MVVFAPDDLRDMQGSILSGYAHLPHVAYVFLQITDAVAARGWVAEVAPSIDDRRALATAPRRHQAQAPNHDEHRVYVSRPREARVAGRGAGDVHPSSARASRAATHVLGDTGGSAPEQWELGGPGTPEVHILVVLYAPDEETLDESRDDGLRRPSCNG